MTNTIRRGVAGLLTLLMSLALILCIPNDATAANTEQAATNLLTNGDFEARSDVPGWNIGMGAGVNLAHGDARTGELALRIVDGGTNGYAVSSDSVFVTAGRAYTVSVYAKGAAGAKIELKFINDSNDPVGTASATLDADATDWTLLSTSATAPGDACMATVYLFTTASCTGTVLFDDVLLEQSTAPVSIVVNGDFENGTTGWAKGYGGTVSTVNKSDTDSTKVLKVDSVMGSYTTLAQKQLSAKAGETYIVSYDYKLNLSQRKSNTVMVRLQFRDSAGKQIGDQQDFYGDKVDVQDWKQFTAETTAPAGTMTVDITLWIWSDNEGEVWIDNLALTPKASDSISNTSFEETATVPNWTVSGSGKKQMAVSAGDVNSGNGALYIKDDSNDAVNVLSDAVTVDSGWIGHEMNLTYAIKGFGTPDTNGMVNSTVPSVFIQFFDKDNKQIGRITAIGSYTRWTWRTATGTVPVGATYFKVWIAYGTSTVGDALIDDITVTMVCDHSSLTYTTSEPASCKAPGKESAYCALCKKTIEREITALDHDWDDGVVTKPASCELTGVKVHTCANCSGTCEKDYPATGHSLLAVPAKAATATENGNIAYWVCETCGKCYADPDENEEIYDRSSVVIPSANDGLAPDDTGDSTALVLMIALMAVAATAVITARSRFVLR